TKSNGPTNLTTVCPSPSTITISTISTSTKPVTASGSQMSVTSSSTPIFIDSNDREIVILRSRSRATTPGVETDVLAEFGDIAIRGTSVDDRSPVCSRHSTPVIEKNIKDIASSSKPTGTKRRDSTCDTKSIEAMLVMQGRQIRALYELQNQHSKSHVNSKPVEKN